MHLLLSGSGFFAVRRIVPRFQRVDVGVQILQGKDPAAAGGIEFGSGFDEVQIGESASRTDGLAQILGATATLNSLQLDTWISAPALPIIMALVPLRHDLGRCHAVGPSRPQPCRHPPASYPLRLFSFIQQVNSLRDRFLENGREFPATIQDRAEQAEMIPEMVS